MYQLYRGLWGPGTSVPLGSWFVGAWYEYTTSVMVCEGLVRVYKLYHSLSGTGTSVPLVLWFIRQWLSRDFVQLTAHSSNIC